MNTAEASIPQNHTIDNNGVMLALSVQGAGPDLLFVHGLGSAQILWEPFVEKLRDRYRCWNLDLRGHGASGRAAPEAYLPHLYESDVAAAVDHIGRPVIGVGHSLGGLSITRAAVSGHPLLAALYVMDSPLLRMPGEQSAVRGVFEAQLAMLREFQPANRPVEDYEAVLAVAPNPVGGTNAETMVPQQLRGRAQSLSQLDPACLEATLNSLTAAVFTPTVSIPLRVIAADPQRGAVFGAEHADELQALNPQSEIETILGVGHQLLMMKGFDEQIRLDLEDWLTRIVG